MREQLLLYGELGEDAYKRYAPSPPNDPDYAIQKIRAVFGAVSETDNSAARADRAQMWERYSELCELLRHSSLPVVETVHRFVMEKNPLAAREMGIEPAGLGLHLREITAFAREFLLDGERSRFSRLLSDRQAQLLAEVAAPLHDALKYLGAYRAQVMPDHEVMTAELVRRCCEDKRVSMRDGTLKTLRPEDLEFIASVIGDHENIEKELGRSQRVRSSDPIDRAKALFTVADVLTGAIVREGQGWRFDQAQLDTRFVDLYFRHIDPVKGKIFRPEWGLHAIEDLTATLNEMVERHGARIEGSLAGESAQATLVRSSLEALDRAESADSARWDEARASGKAKPDKLLSPEQLERISKSRDSLLALLASERLG